MANVPGTDANEVIQGRMIEVITERLHNDCLAAQPTVSGTKAQFLLETGNRRLWFDRDGAGGVREPNSRSRSRATMVERRRSH